MAEPRKVAPRRGEVYLVRFDPTLGAEIQKTRPALVLQNDIANRHSPITVVAALTSQFETPLYPTEVLVRASEGALSADSVVLLNQIRPLGQPGARRPVGAFRLLHPSTAAAPRASGGADVDKVEASQ